MNKRSFLKSILQTAAAVVTLSAVEVFGVKQKVIGLAARKFRSEPICFVDMMFAKEAKRLEGVIKDTWKTRSALSYLMDKPTLPDGAGFNHKIIT